MAQIKKLGIIVFVLAVTFCTNFVQARDLVNSGRNDGSQGSVDFNVTVTGGSLTGHIDYAVYDTAITPDPLPGIGGTGKYIYAYQIFNDNLSKAIGYFSIFGINLHSMDVENNTVGAKADPAPAGINPTSKGATAQNKKVEWKFAGGNGGTLVAGNNSYLLYFRSNTDWVDGSYEIQQSNTIPVDGSEAPEPASLALISLGSLFFAARRKRK